MPRRNHRIHVAIDERTSKLIRQHLPVGIRSSFYRRVLSDALAAFEAHGTHALALYLQDKLTIELVERDDGEGTV